MAQGVSFKGNAYLNSDNFNSSFPFHSQTRTVYDSAQLQTLQQLFHTNKELRGTRRERKWQEGGENCRMNSFTDFTLHTIHWGGGEMLENINKGDHVEDIASCGRIILYLSFFHTWRNSRQNILKITWDISTMPDQAHFFQWSITIFQHNPWPLWCICPKSVWG